MVIVSYGRTTLGSVSKVRNYRFDSKGGVIRDIIVTATPYIEENSIKINVYKNGEELNYTINCYDKDVCKVDLEALERKIKKSVM